MRRSRIAIAGLAVLCGGLACAHDEGAIGPKVHSVRFEGNQQFSAGTLRAKLMTEQTGWWPLAPAKRLDIAALDLDVRRVSAFYADQGYFDARVVQKRVIPRPGKKETEAVEVILTIEEGKPTFIQRVEIAGMPGDDASKRATEVVRAQSVIAGKRFEYANYDEARARITADLQDAGYAYAKVEGNVAVDRDRHQAIVEYRVTPGPIVRFGATTIVGAGAIPEWKLRRRLTWSAGDKYDPDHIATTEGRLYDLGVFSTVRIQLPPEPTPQPDVTVNVSPGKLHEVRLGGGVGVDTQRQEVRLRGEWNISNFLGGLRKLRLQAKPAWAMIPSFVNPRRSGPVAELQGTLTQPDLFGTSVTGQATAGYDLMLTEGYAARGPRGNLGVRRSFWRDRILAGLGWTLQYLDFYDINTDVFDPRSTSLGLGFRDPYRLAYAEQFVQLDLRDRVRSGGLAGFVGVRFEQGSPLLAGQFRYTAVVPELKLLVPLGKRVVLAGRGLAGGLFPVGGAAVDSPVTRRFRLGGPSSHRGFSYGRLAPQVADQAGNAIPVGGDGELLLSVEVRVEVFQLAGGWVSVAPFFDSGDVTVDFGSLSPRHLHHAAGVAATYATPIGIVRAGGAVRLNRLDGTVTPGTPIANPDPGQRFAFHITIGEAF